MIGFLDFDNLTIKMKIVNKNKCWVAKKAVVFQLISLKFGTFFFPTFSAVNCSVYKTTKNGSKFLVLKHSAQRNFGLLSGTPLGYLLMPCPRQKAH